MHFPHEHLDSEYNGNAFAQYKCKYCATGFGKGPTYPSNKDPQGNPYAKVTFDALHATYTTKHDEWIRSVVEHIKTHPIIECQFCHSLMKKGALKAHQKSFGCTVSRREHMMEERGYKEVDADYKLLTSVTNVLARKMLHATAYSNDHFDCEEVRDVIHTERDNAKRLLCHLAGIRLAYTKYNKINPNLDADDPKQGWQLVAWAPRDTVAALTQVFKKWHKLGYQEQYNKPEIKMEAYLRMWEWLLSDEDSRFAAIGLWELADEPL